jgi:two-component system cell cycle sensor histidine kinase/response regulator CckA
LLASCHDGRSGDLVASNESKAVGALSDETVRAVIEHAADGIFIATDEGRFVEVNASGHRLLGYAPGGLVGKAFTDVLPPREWPRAGAAIADVRAGHELDEVRRFLRKDGTEVEAEVRSQRLGPGLLMAFVRDLGHRRSQEIKIRHSEAQLRSILLTAPDIIMTVDRAGTILFMNRTQQPQTPEEVIGTCSFDHVPAESRPRVVAAVERVFATREVDEYEVMGPPRTDGKRDWWSVRAGPLIEGDQVVAVTLCATNIARRREADEAKARLEEQLRQAQKLESIGRLAGGIAHDFNNLLTSILGFLDLARVSQPAGAPVIELLDGATLAAKRGATLTRQMLAFARKQIVHPTVVVLDDIVQSMIPMVRRLVGEDLDMKVALSSTRDRVEVDVGSLEQVIMNLVVNARDAIDGPGRITIETGSAELDADYARDHATRPGRHVFLAVTDTGSGMSDAIAARAFEPFFTTKPVGKGTGLGLAMCEGIVRQAGGHIAVESAPGRGATFRVYLPRAAAEPIPAQKTPPDRPAGGRETLLLVEDEPLVLRMARRSLVEFGYNVLTASDALEALELVQRHTEPIHLLVSDVIMPRMSGRELAARVLALRPEIRVLFSSGYTADAFAADGVLDEGVNFLPKPYSPSTLAAAIRDVLDK